MNARLFRLARLGWLATFVAALMFEALTVLAVFRTALSPCAGDCTATSIQLSAAKAEGLRAMGISLEFYATYIVAMGLLAFLTFAGIAALIFWRKSDDAMALFCAFTLLTFGGAISSHDLFVATEPEWYIPVALMTMLGQVCFYVFFCIFPDGRFVPRWTVWAAVLWSAFWLPTLFLPGYAPFIGGPLFAVFWLIPVGAQVYRYRRTSNAVQRQQTKWVVYGLAVGIVAFLGLLAYGNVINPSIQTSPVGSLLAITLFDGALLLIPISIGVAILHSRLWEIDIIIRRTLIYALFSVLLLFVYFGSVFVLQQILRALTGQQQSELVTVVSTLVIAALFNPLRQRVQAFIDQRFYRRKYDAAQVLAAFSASARDEVDLSRLRSSLLAVVEETMGPEHLSLWLREPSQQMPTREQSR